MTTVHVAILLYRIRRECWVKMQWYSRHKYIHNGFLRSYSDLASDCEGAYTDLWKSHEATGSSLSHPTRLRRHGWHGDDCRRAEWHRGRSPSDWWLAPSAPAQSCHAKHTNVTTISHNFLKLSWIEQDNQSWQTLARNDAHVTSKRMFSSYHTIDVVSYFGGIFCPISQSWRILK